MTFKLWLTFVCVSLCVLPPFLPYFFAQEFIHADRDLTFEIPESKIISKMTDHNNNNNNTQDTDLSQLRQDENPVIAASNSIDNGDQTAATQRRKNNYNNRGISTKLELETSEDEDDVSFESYPSTNGGNGINNNNINNDENINMVLGTADNNDGNVNAHGNSNGNKTLGNNDDASLSSRHAAHGHNTRSR